MLSNQFTGLNTKKENQEYEMMYKKVNNSMIFQHECRVRDAENMVENLCNELYDNLKSCIFRTAHALKKAYKYDNFGAALKDAWKEWKERNGQ